MAGISGYQDGTYTRKQERQILGAMLGAKPSARPLGAGSGITSIPSLAATSTTWTVGSFTAVLDVETDATMGPSLCVFDGNSTGTVTAASGSFIRYDLLYVTILDPSTPPSVQYVAGTTGTTLPATPANSIPLAQITVPISGGGSPTITLIAPVAVAAGGLQPVTSSGTYPSAPYNGQQIYDKALDAVFVWNGSSWLPPSPLGFVICVGTYSITPVANADTTQAVAFSGGTFLAGTAFTSTPTVLVTPTTATTGATTLSFAAASASTTGFTGHINRSTTTATGFSYVAIGT